MTHCVLIIDGYGDVRVWQRGSLEDCVEWGTMLPSNGWSLYAIKSLV